MKNAFVISVVQRLVERLIHRNVLAGKKSDAYRLLLNEFPVCFKADVFLLVVCSRVVVRIGCSHI